MQYPWNSPQYDISVVSKLVSAVWWFGTDVTVELQRSRIRVIASTRFPSTTKDETKRFHPHVACNIHEIIVYVVNILYLILRYPCGGFATMPQADLDASESPSAKYKINRGDEVLEEYTVSVISSSI